MKKIIAAAAAALLAVSMGAACPASEMVGISGEGTVQEENKAIGEKTEEAQILELTNGTGKDITAFAVKQGTDAEEFSENLPPAEDVFADGETRTFFYGAKDAEAAAEAPASAEDAEAAAEAQTDAEDAEAAAEAPASTEDAEAAAEAPASAEDAESAAEAQTSAEGAEAAPEELLLTVRLTFADDTAAEFHVWAVEETDTYEIRLEEELAYLVYEKEGQERSTLEWEKSEAAKQQEPETSAPEEEPAEYDDYYDDAYYDDAYYDAYYDDAYYDDTYYDDVYYDDSYDDTYYDDYGGGGDAGENCLQGGLMN